MDFTFTGAMDATEQKMGMSLEDIIKVKQKDAGVRRSNRKKAPKEDAGNKKVSKAKATSAKVREGCELPRPLATVGGEAIEGVSDYRQWGLQMPM